MVRDKEYKIVRLAFGVKVFFCGNSYQPKKCLASQYELLLFPHQSSLKPANTLRDVGKVTKTLAIPHCYTFIIDKTFHKSIFVHGLVST